MAAFDQVMNVVCGYRGVSGADLVGAARSQKIARPRMELCFLAQKHTSLSFSAIGREIGRDHTSVMSAISRIKHLKTEHPQLSVDLELMSRLIEQADDTVPVEHAFVGTVLTAYRVLTQRLTPQDLTSQELNGLAQYVLSSAFPQTDPEKMEQ